MVRFVPHFEMGVGFDCFLLSGAGPMAYGNNNGAAYGPVTSSYGSNNNYGIINVFSSFLFSSFA